jgi:hypothetical protein
MQDFTVGVTAVVFDFQLDVDRTQQDFALFNALLRFSFVWHFLKRIIECHDFLRQLSPWHLLSMTVYLNSIPSIKFGQPDLQR